MNVLVLSRPSRNASTFRTRSSASSHHTPSLHISLIAMSLNIYAYLFCGERVLRMPYIFVFFSSTNFLASFPVPDAQTFRQWSVPVFVPTPILRLRESAEYPCPLPSNFRKILVDSDSSLSIHRDSRFDYNYLLLCPPPPAYPKHRDFSGVFSSPRTSSFSRENPLRGSLYTSHDSALSRPSLALRVSVHPRAR